jgi:hypothetical protein
MTVLYLRAGKRHRACLLLVPVLLLMPVLTRANAFTDEIDQAQVSAEELQQAQKQIETPRVEPLKEVLFVPSFHRQKTEDSFSSALCHSCHGHAPHFRNARTRAFLNMHGRTVACETCHWQPDDKSLQYVRVSLPAGQTETKLVVPKYNETQLWTPKESPWSRELLQQWKTADEVLKAEIKSRLHHPLKDKGVSCTACHTNKDGMLNWRELGYEPGRIPKLQDNPTAAFLQRTEPESPEDPVVRIHLKDLLE